MFAYNPTVDDTSGQILGQGMVGAANTKANAQVKMVDDIGGALVNLAGAYGASREMADMGDTAYEALGAIGEMYPGMKSTYGALGKMDPRTRRLASMSILDNLGAISQLGIAGMNNQTRQQGQALTAAMPKVRNIADAQAQVAAGQGTMPTPSGINFDYVR